MSKKGSAQVITQASTPAPQVIPLNDAKQVFERALDLLNRMSDGQVVIGNGKVDGHRVEPPRETVRERRIAAQRIFGPAVDESLPRDLRHVQEPKRQRKVRNLAPRRVYSLKPIRTKEQTKAIQSLTPMGSAIAVYLATHPRTSAPELVVQLDTKKKTVDNLLSVLSRLGLILKEDYHK